MMVVVVMMTMMMVFTTTVMKTAQMSIFCQLSFQLGDAKSLHGTGK